MKVNKNTLLLIIGALAIYNIIFLRGGIQAALYQIPAILVAITIHEFGHALVATLLGDKSNKKRATLNPFMHIDLLGLLMLFAIGIGWGKPVEVRKENIRGRSKNIEKKEALIALAGPLFNLLLALILQILIYKTPIGATSISFNLAMTIIGINISLGVFNLIPVPPLDGYNIIKFILPKGFKRTVDLNQDVIMVVFLVFMMLFGNYVMTLLVSPMVGHIQNLALSLI